MDQNSIIETHLHQLKTDWNHNIDTTILETLGAENIATFPQTGILLKPGSQFFLILDPHNYFPYAYKARTHVNSNSIRNFQISYPETNFLKISYIIPPSFTKIGSFTCKIAPKCPPPNFQGVNLREINLQNNTTTCFSTLLERPSLTNREIVAPCTITLNLFRIFI